VESSDANALEIDGNSAVDAAMAMSARGRVKIRLAMEEKAFLPPVLFYSTNCADACFPSSS